MKQITTTFLKGLAAVLPLAITIYAVYWLAVSCETMMKGLLEKVLPNTTVYFPGLGTLVGLGLIFLVGFFLQMWIAQALFGWFEKLLSRVPLVHTIYGSVKDLLSFFVGSKDKQMNQVVIVRMTDPPMRMLGFVTRDTFDDLPPGVGDQNTVAVYLPMSYQLGGFTVMVPRDKVEPIDMTTEQALRFCVTAGMTAKKEDGKAPKTPPAK